MKITASTLETGIDVMWSKNNWMSSNLGERRVDQTREFVVTMTPYAFKEVSFADASTSVCLDIYHTQNKLYLALSGGMDSEYVLRCFHANGIPITPIIICCGNEIEVNRALLICSELGITPIVKQISEYDLIRCFKRLVFDVLGGIGYNSTHVVLAKQIADSLGGSLVIGNHIIGESTDIIQEDPFVYMSEWDLYSDHVFDQYPCFHFFLHTPDIVHSMLPKTLGMEWQKYRSQLYNLEYRPKIKARYSKQTLDILSHMTTPKSNTSVSWSKQTIQDIFKHHVSA